MRTIPLLLVPLTLTTVLSAPPAHAGGECVAVYPGATSGICLGATCVAGDTVTLTVVGVAAGIASCGNGDAFCRTTATLPACTDTATAGASFGFLSCSVDPLGTQAFAMAVCSVPSAST